MSSEDLPIGMLDTIRLHDEGQKSATYRLGIIYFEGLGVEKDSTKAMEYFDAIGAGKLHDFSEEWLVAPNPDARTTAFKVLEIAAERGCIAAYHTMGNVYMGMPYVKGKTRDVEEARRCFSKGAELGDLNSARALERLKNPIHKIGPIGCWVLIAIILVILLCLIF